MPAPCPWQTIVPLGQLYIWGHRLGSGHFTFPSRMVNFHDPVKIARDFCAYPSPPGSGAWTQSTCRFFTVSLVKLWHTVDGLFMWVCPASWSFGITQPDPLFYSWEFFTTLDYEWSFIQRRRPYLWTIWVCGPEAFLLVFG